MHTLYKTMKVCFAYNKSDQEDDMSWDRSWSFKQKHLTTNLIAQKSASVAEQYIGVTVTVEKEADDCTTIFFAVPEGQTEQTEHAKTIEISIYHMGKNQHIISLETDASDNRLSQDADHLAEDIADSFGASPLEE